MVHRKGHRSTRRRSSSRKGSRKAHRKSHRKGSRSAHRRRQHGGAAASCAAQPLFNREMFSQQGGMAPITEDGFLLDGPSRVQAEVSSLDAAFSQLPQVIPRQSGGRRRRSAHKGRKGRRSARKSHRKSHRKGHRRSAQHGGAHQLAGYTDSYMSGVDIAKSGSNDQFLEYLPAKGAQPATA